MIEYFTIFVKYLVPNVESHNPPETSNIEKTIIPVVASPIKVEVSRGVIDLENPEFNDVSQEINQITIDFYSMKINELYIIHNFVTTKKNCTNVPWPRK